MQRDGPVFLLQCLSSSPPAKQPWSLEGMESVIPSPSNQVVRYMTKQGWWTKGLVFFLLVFFFIFIMSKVIKKKLKKKKGPESRHKDFQTRKLKDIIAVIWHDFFLLQKIRNRKFQLAKVLNSVPTWTWELRVRCPGTESSHPQQGITSGYTNRFEVLRVRSTGWVPGEKEQEFLARLSACEPRAPGCWHLTTFILWLHTGNADSEPFQDGCMKGKAVTAARLRRNRGNSTRIPDQATTSSGNHIFH